MNPPKLFVENNQFRGACMEENSIVAVFTHVNSVVRSLVKLSCMPNYATQSSVWSGVKKYFYNRHAIFKNIHDLLFQEKIGNCWKRCPSAANCKNKCGRPMKLFQCDGSMDFVHNEMRKLVTSNGVTLVTTNPYTSQQNGYGNEMNRTWWTLLGRCFWRKVCRSVYGLKRLILPFIVWTELSEVV